VDFFKRKLKTTVDAVLTKEGRKGVTLPVTASIVYDYVKFVNIVRKEIVETFVFH
jgi:hypothetical protein